MRFMFVASVAAWFSRSSLRKLGNRLAAGETGAARMPSAGGQIDQSAEIECRQATDSFSGIVQHANITSKGRGRQVLPVLRFRAPRQAGAHTRDVRGLRVSNQESFEYPAAASRNTL